MNCTGEISALLWINALLKFCVTFFFNCLFFIAFLFFKPVLEQHFLPEDANADEPELTADVLGVEGVEEPPSNNESMRSVKMDERRPPPDEEPVEVLFKRSSKMLVRLAPDPEELPKRSAIMPSKRSVPVPLPRKRSSPSSNKDSSEPLLMRVSNMSPNKLLIEKEPPPVELPLNNSLKSVEKKLEPPEDDPPNNHDKTLLKSDEKLNPLPEDPSEDEPPNNDEKMLPKSEDKLKPLPPEVELPSDTEVEDDPPKSDENKLPKSELKLKLLPLLSSEEVESLLEPANKEPKMSLKRLLKLTSLPVFELIGAVMLLGPNKVPKSPEKSDPKLSDEPDFVAGELGEVEELPSKAPKRSPTKESVEVEVE
jgi:hypothetical protein